MGGGSFIDDLFDSVFDPIKDAFEGIVDVAFKGVREIFKGMSKITGTSLFDKIGEGFYALGSSIAKLELGGILQGLGIVAGFVLAPFGGFGIALNILTLSYNMYSLGSQLKALEDMLKYQITLNFSYGALSMAEKGEWLAGGVCRSEVLAGGDMFNPTGIIDANGMAYGYNGVSDTTLLNSINNAYENLAGGSTYNAHLAGSHNWRPNKIVNKYFNSTSSTLL